MVTQVRLRRRSTVGVALLLLATIPRVAGMANRPRFAVHADIPAIGTPRCCATGPPNGTAGIEPATETMAVATISLAVLANDNRPCHKLTFS